MPNDFSRHCWATACGLSPTYSTAPYWNADTHNAARLDQADSADARDCEQCMLSGPPGAGDGHQPTPLVYGAAVAARICTAAIAP